jgi:hypothetical protein
MATPMSAAQFAARLRAEGVTVVEVGDWETRNRNHKGPWGPVHGVMIHHTVTRGDTKAQTDASVALCRDGHSTLPGPLCHGVIDKQGVVHLVGYGRTNHAGMGDDDVEQAVINETALPVDDEANTDGNRGFYGFECINLGDGEDPWPAAQLLAVERVSAAICRHHGWGVRSVIGHLEWQPGKVDPRGFSMQTMRGRVGARLDGNQEDDMPTPEEYAEAVWAHKLTSPTAAPGTDATRAAGTFLRYTDAKQQQLLSKLAELKTIETGQSAAIAALAGQLGQDVDTATVVAAVQQAIADAVVRVSVDVTGPDAM